MNHVSTSARLLSLTLVGVLSSCVYFTQDIPDKPYKGRPPKLTTPPLATPAATPAATPGSAQMPLPGAATKPTAVPAPPPRHDAKPTGKPSSHITQPGHATVKPAEPKVQTPTKPKADPKPEPKKPSLLPDTPPSKSAAKPSGDTPVAKEVPGDPTRVYNPYNPSRTIQILDKNGKRWPSGKRLKIKGQDKYFLVP